MNKLLKTAICYVLIILLSCAVYGSARASQVLCAHSKITVAAEKSSEMEAVCTAVQNGFVFLRSIGLDFSGSLAITLLKTMPSNGQESVIGQYDSRSNKISLLNYEAAVTSSRLAPPAFGTPMNPEIWRGYVVHELSHAAAHHTFVAGVPVLTASEYIASVALISTLPAAEREEIIRNYPELSGFDEPGEITFGYYLLDPSRFAVNAYLHFSKPENGQRFISQLLREGFPDDW